MDDISNNIVFNKRKRYNRLWLFAILFFSSIAFSDKNIIYKINGLSKNLKQNARLYLAILPPIKPQQLPEYQQEIRDTLKKSLMALGYYQPKIELNRNGKKTVTINIDPGQPIIIESLQINLKGDAKNDSAFKQLIKQSTLKTGDVLNDGEYESLKTSLNNLALTRGYFDANIIDHQVKVFPDKHTATIVITINSGNRYQFGSIIYDDSISENIRTLVNTMINFKLDQPYLSEKLSKLNIELAATGFFKYIEVRPIKEKANRGAIPIFIKVTPKTAWELESGIGFSTDEKARVFQNIDKPWLNEKGHSFSSDIKISQHITEISANYKIPYGNPLLEYYSLNGGYQKTMIQDTNNNLFFASINKWHKRNGFWDQNFFIRIDYENYTQGLQNSSNLLLIPGMLFEHRKIIGNPIEPNFGSHYTLRFETSAKAWQSDVDFIKVVGKAKWLTSFFQNHRAIIRIEQGAILVDEITSIPPTIRFFTGGDQTIRGYSYESISPTDNNNRLLGGQYLSVASMEYDIKVLDQWRLALFVDSGTVTNDYKKDQIEWKTGLGPGIRWITPLGSLKLDVAFAVSEPDSPWRIHFSMGPDL